MLATQAPLPQYFEISGRPLDAGYLYFGVANQNPETTPVAVFWDLAGTQPAAQPIRTLNGYAARNGIPAQIYTAGDYSISVKSKNSTLIFYAASGGAFNNALSLATDLASTNSAAKAAGQVGFSSALAYLVGTVGAKLKEVFSTIDKGAAADGVTLDQAAVATAITSIAATGGWLNVPGPSLLSYGRKLQPNQLQVNHHDYAILGADNKVSNPTFATAAVGWTLANFAYSAGPDKITHAAGTVGSASIAGMLLEPYCLYAIQVTINTTTSGVVNFTLNGTDLIQGVYTDAGGVPIDGYWFDSTPVQTYGTGANGVGGASGWPNTSATQWTFQYLFSSAAPITGNLVITTDTRWAGNIQAINVIKVSQEAQFAYASLSQAEGAAGTYRTPVGWKNLNNESGCLIFGDRMTGALIPVTPGAPPYAGAFNTILGFKAGASQITGVENVFVGAYAGQTVDGSGNSAFGYSAMKYASKAMECSAFGYKSQASSVTGIANTSIGFETLFNNITGSYNTALGWGAMRLSIGATRCTAVGFAASISNGGGADNTHVGFRSGPWTADIGTAVSGFAQQTALGSGAFTFGNGSIAIGYNAAAGINGANVVNAIALGTGASCQGGDNSVAIGEAASVTNASATAVGATASVQGQGGVSVGIDARSVGTEAVAIGSSSRASGTNDTSVGRGAGLNITGGNNTSLGNTAGALGGAQAYANTTNLGFGAIPTASNQVNLGNTSVAAIRAQVTSITALSDARDKKDVEDLPLGLDFINDARMVRFKWAMRDGTERADVFETGVIAQELQALQLKHDAQWLGLVDDSNPDRIEATPMRLVFPLIKAVQELSAEVARLRAVVDGKAA